MSRMCSQSITRSSPIEIFHTVVMTPLPQWLAVLCLLALTACAHNPSRPDLKRLYESANLSVPQPPLIIAPGIMGSKLRDRTTHKVVWPGTLWHLAVSRYPALALGIDPETLHSEPGNLEAFALTDKAAGYHFYDTIVDTMVRFGGFTVTTAGTPVHDPYERHLYLFPYDWRLDNVESARRLSALIDQLRVDYGRPDLKVDIVAHSMGGVIARYLLRFGAEDVLDRDELPPVTMAGESKINRLILLGTPSFGSTNAVQQVIAGAQIVLKRIEPETVATLPSIYQLFPNVDRKPLIGIDGRPLRKVPEDANSAERDVFDVTTWRDLQWSVFDPQVIARVGPERADLLQRAFAVYLKRAGRLQRALQEPQPDSSVKLVVFGADCDLTAARILVEADNGRMVPRFDPHEIKHPRPGVPYDALLREPGDGQVGKASLLGRQSFDPTVVSRGSFPIAFSFFLCSAHSDLPGNINFQDNLLNVLLSR
jgi:pimeloyl-ACP methyl ester carboxylesterase